MTVDNNGNAGISGIGNTSTNSDNHPSHVDTEGIELPLTQPEEQGEFRAMDEHPKEVGEDRENMEGTRRSTDENLAEKVDKEGNQPIPLDIPKRDIDQLSTLQAEEDPTEVEIRKPGKYIQLEIIADNGPSGQKDNPTILYGIQLPMAQPEMLGECRGKTASSDGGKDEDEVDWGIANVDEHSKGVDEDRENVEGTTRKHPKEQRKIYPSTMDNTKSIQHSYTIHIPSNELVLKLTNKGQLLSDIVKIATTKDLPPMDTTLINRPLDGSP